MTPTPRQIDDFMIEQLLGRGAFGDVFLGARPGQPAYALKVARDAEGKARLADEARLAEACSHPGLLPVLEAHLDHQPPYLVRPFCAGGNLRQRLEHGALPEPEVERLVLALLEALAALHGAGVVHRDLKPENLLLTDEENGKGELRVADLGLGAAQRGEEALLSAGLASRGEVAGTLDYMAPEQREGEGDARVDLYAVGVIAFELLTGVRPDRNDALASFVELSPARLARWERFYLGCCARLDRRYPSAAAAIVALQAPLASDAALPAIESPSTESGGWRDGMFWLLAVVVGCLIWLIGMAIFASASGDGTSPPRGQLRAPQQQATTGATRGYTHPRQSSTEPAQGSRR